LTNRASSTGATSSGQRRGGQRGASGSSLSLELRGSNASLSASAQSKSNFTVRLNYLVGSHEQPLIGPAGPPRPRPGSSIFAVSAAGHAGSPELDVNLGRLDAGLVGSERPRTFSPRLI
jgi:hypothetical protein